MEELAGFDEFMEKQNRAKEIKKSKRHNKWELLRKEKEGKALENY